MLAIDFGPAGSVVVVGRLDAAQSPVAQAFLDRVEGTVTLDCSALEYISSAGLGVLLKTQKRLLASSGKLRLTGVNRHLQDVFGYSGFDQRVEIARRASPPGVAASRAHEGALSRVRAQGVESLS